MVHGRNLRLNMVFRELLTSFGLEVVTWNDAVAAASAQGGPNVSVPDIIDAGFELSHGIVVLMTPDDLVQLHPDLREHDEPEEQPSLQPRPNVIFEAGMAWMSHRKHTVLIEAGSLRGLTDLSGIHTVRFNGSPSSRELLAIKLRAAGFEVNDPDPTADMTDLIAGIPVVPPSTVTDARIVPRAEGTVTKAATLAGNMRVSVLDRLAEMRRNQLKTSEVLQLDVEEVSMELHVEPDVIRLELDDLIVHGLVAPFAESFGRRAVDGACQITVKGLDELTRLRGAS